MLPLAKITQSDPMLFYPDQSGVLIALDRALEDCGPRYGYATMQKVLTELHALPLPPTQDREDYFRGIMNILNAHGIEPWQGKTVALVGYINANDDRPSLLYDNVQILLRGAQLLDLSKEVTGRPLTSANARTLAKDQKADFIITGNVLNAGDNPYPADTMEACALLLKQDGKAIHLLGFGEGNLETAHLNDAQLLERIGQRHLHNYPDGRSFAKNTSPAAAIYVQDREIGTPGTSIHEGKGEGPLTGLSNGKPPRGA